jgi:hypothetical protein
MCQAQWYTPVIPTQETEAGGSQNPGQLGYAVRLCLKKKKKKKMIQGQLRQKVSKTPISNNKMGMGMVLYACHPSYV